ncbi:DUF3168 domain-containing protein [Brucella grignonensis]|uniref:DUF3168 domain-containing protein n=1 Tax=Brucella grignonensis TaxID=94627 RepID=A0A256F783_9HYPH|nr:DUF3168 domain-containing protein [Brucella grignonensis]NKB83088.1 DUF3168 domain-containing protein [Brucella grignonensis]OYR10727.1 hypothetical protein CEV33_2192 [Brucella grignonensis]
MFEPTLALQTAIRARLIMKPELTALVPANNIRSGATRPDTTPSIIIADGTTSLHGYDYTAQRCAWVNLDLHIWTLDSEQDLVKQITGEVMAALDKQSLNIEGGYCDHFRPTSTRFMRDPDPAYGHAVLSVEALVRWFV